MSEQATQQAGEKIVFHWLRPDQWGLIEPQYAEWGVPAPPPELARVVVAVDTERHKIAGFLVFQTVVHCEPLYVAEEYRASSVTRDLIDEGFKPFREAGTGLYAFVPEDRPEVERLVRRAGMTVLDWKVAAIDFGGGQS